MKQQNSLLQYAIVAALSMPLNSFADVFSTAAGIDVGRTGVTGAKGPLILASEQPVETTNKLINKNGRLVVRFPTIPSYLATSDSPMYITVALKGGLKFATASVGGTNTAGMMLLCQTAGSNKYTAATINAKPTDGGTTVTFQIRNGVKLDGSGLCAMFVRTGAISPAVVTAATATGPRSGWYKGLVVGDHSISALIEYKEGFADKSKAVVGTIISFSNSFKPVFSPKGQVDGAPLTTAANPVIDVKTTSQKFAKHTSVDSTFTEAFLGSVRLYNTGLYLINTAVKPKVSAMLKTAVLTLEGASLAAAKSVFLTTGKAGDACDDTQKIVDAVPTGTVVSFNKITPQNISAGVNVCLTVDGKTAIPAGVVTATLTGTAQTGWKPSLGSTTDLVTIKKNGLSFRVLNIPPNPAAPAETGFVRLYNTNSFEVTVRGVMYNEAGELIGEAKEIAKIAGNKVVPLNVATLQTLFGTWTGRARLLIDVDASDFKVVSLVRSPTGTLLNVSSESGN